MADREDGMSVKVKGEVMEAMVGGDGGVGAPGQEVIEGELNSREELVPKVEGELGARGLIHLLPCASDL